MATQPLGLIRSGTDDGTTDAVTLQRWGHAGIQQDRVRTPVANDIDETTQPAFAPGSHPRQAVPLQPISPWDGRQAMFESRRVQLIQLFVDKSPTHLHIY